MSRGLAVVDLMKGDVTMWIAPIVMCASSVGSVTRQYIVVSRDVAGEDEAGVELPVVDHTRSRSSCSGNSVFDFINLEQ